MCSGPAIVIALVNPPIYGLVHTPKVLEEKLAKCDLTRIIVVLVTNTVQRSQQLLKSNFPGIFQPFKVGTGLGSFDPL